MNTKRYLQQQAQQDREEILKSDNGALLRALQEQVQPKPKTPPRLKVWLPAALSAATAVAVAITCAVVFYPAETGTVEYLDTNLLYAVSTLEELNRDVKEVEIEIDAAFYSYSVKKTTDKISGDVLYYTTTVSDSDNIYQLEIVTVCNPNYKYKNFHFNSETKSTALANYTVTYENSVAADPEFGIDSLSVKAEIHKGKEFIYVTEYSEILSSPEGTFLEVLQSIVK